eukprot:Phypoly_transcript_12562.p1 GENE.Phypoly_transcript_12562~~Phypoly_transcript_12562.p1  ORF type:complete len:337 (+),score=23.57 Phypoly_transcript_12562:114-1124(+)
MQCSGCKEQKLSNEFPRRVTPSCRHRPWCLRCVVASYNKSETCPDLACVQHINKSQYEHLCSLLGLVVHESQFVTPTISAPQYTSSTFIIIVTTLTGEFKEISVKSTDSVRALCRTIQSRFGIDEAHQRLFFNGKELDLSTKLTENGVGPNSRIQVQQLLLAIHGHSNLNNIEFKLQWGYRTVPPAYLNASCLAYCGDSYYGAIDFKQQYSLTGISHSGKAKIYYKYKIGTQSISVNLKSVHDNVTKLYFVLSVCKLKSLKFFVNPRIELYDIDNPSVSLSDYQIADAGNSKAVILAYLERQGSGWGVTAMGTRSNGTVFNYDDIVHTIHRAMREY